MRMCVSPSAARPDAEEDLAYFPGHPKRSEEVINRYFGSW